MRSNRPHPALLLTAAIVVAFGAVWGPSEASPSSLQFQPVNIRVTCAGNEVDDVSVRPWVAHASRGQSQQLRWQLAGGGVGSVSIRPKSSSSWPFGSTPPLTVTAGGNGTTSGAITGAQGTYHYDIIADCGAGPTIIDPRMDIDP